MIVFGQNGFHSMAEQLFNGAGNLPNAGPLLSGLDLAFQNIGSEISCIHTLFHSKRIRLAISVDDNMPIDSIAVLCCPAILQPRSADRVTLSKDREAA